MSSTVEKGNKFENRVFQLLEQELTSERLLVNPKYSKIYQKKGYYSERRKNMIIVDISIEVFLPNQDEMSFIILIECKDYGKNIPVDDIEEFNSKIEQIAGLNAKGIFVSSTALQKGALNYAKSRKIAVIRLLDNDRISWVLTRTAVGQITIDHIQRKESTIYHGLTEDNYKHDYIDTYGMFGSLYTHSLYILFKELISFEIDLIYKIDELIVVAKKDKSFLPYMSEEMIKRKAENVLRLISFRNSETSIDEILKILEGENKINVIYSDKIGFDILGRDIYATISTNPLEIIISKAITKSIHRLRYTVAHELGHYFLNHFDFLKAERYTEEVFEQYNRLDQKELKRFEWQANYFASCLLMPEKLFKAKYFLMMENYNILHKKNGILYLDNQKCNLNIFYDITNILKREFNVSRKAVEIRLKGLGLLEDKRTGFNY